MAKKEKHYTVKNKSKSVIELRGKSGKRKPLLPGKKEVFTNEEYSDFQKSLSVFHMLVEVMQTEDRKKPAPVQDADPAPEPIGEPEVSAQDEAPVEEVVAETEPQQEEEKAVESEAPKTAKKKTRRKKAKKKAKKKA